MTRWRIEEYDSKGTLVLVEYDRPSSYVGGWMTSFLSTQKKGRHVVLTPTRRAA